MTLNQQRDVTTTEASELGWRPGRWPIECCVGGRRFEFVRAIRRDGTVQRVHYRTHAGDHELVVVND